MPENQLGSYLKKLRKSNNYTQEYVASCLDIIRQSYSHYETGRTTPNNETLQKLATLYHIPLQNFISLQLGSVPAAENTLSESALCPGLSAQELQLLSSFRRLSPQDQQDITDFIRVKLEREL